MKKQKNIPVLRFPEFKEEWQLKNLDNIAEFTSSKRVFLSDYVKEGIPFYRGKEITELKLGETPQDLLFITNEAYESFKKNHGVPVRGDILITAVGTLGNVLKVTNDNPFYFKDGNLIWIRKITVSSDFLEILLEVKADDIFKTAIGSSQKALTMVELRKLSFLFPQPNEQQKIAYFITAIDDKLQSLKKKKTLLEQYKKGVMQKLFSQELRFKDDKGKAFPEWRNTTLGEVTIINPKLEKLPSEFTYIDLESVEKGTLIKRQIIRLADAPSRAQRLLNYNDVLFQMVRPYQQNNLLFKEKEANYVASTGYAQMRTNQNSSFLYQLLHSGDFINKVIDRCTGTSFPAISASDLAKIEISIPSISEQTQIANFLSSIDDKITHCNNQIEKMEQYKKGLLQKMFC